MMYSRRRLPMCAVAAMSLAGASVALTMGSPPAGAVVKNNSFAGYRVTDAAGITSFDSTVTVPTVSCPATGSFSGYLSSQLAGTTASGGVFVHLACATGVSSDTAFVTFTTVTNGTKHFTVAAGNTLQMQLTVTVSKKGKTALKAVVDDVTTGVVTTKAVSFDGVAKDTTAADEFQHTGKAAVPPFGTAQWSGATANGLTLAAADATRYNMTETGTTLVSASTLGATGSSFSVKFHAST